MTTYEAISLVAQFGLLQIATITLSVTIVVYLTTKAQAPVFIAVRPGRTRMR